MASYFDKHITSWNRTIAFRKGEFLGRLEAFDSKNGSVASLCGYGTVDKISKGEKFDIVFVHFGFKNSRVIPLIFKDPESRKQIIQLRVNRQALFFGYSYYIKDKIENGEKVRNGKILFYIQNILTFPIPNAVDIKHKVYEDEKIILSPNEEKDYKNKYDEMSEFLESIENK